MKNNEQLQNAKPILEVNNLKKYFLNKGIVNKAVDNVSFTVKEGEILGLIGESGSGKTTVGRSLLRLYDDYNGFVRLDGQIISGKRISRKRRKFMHKNIQMIFQDPMASLNGQNTIFTILKEPLIVNGVINSKIKDLSSDWNDVKNNFHYTFLEASLQFELENLKISNQYWEPFLTKWQKEFQNIEFLTNETNEDMFNSYFSYLEEKNKINSIVINNLYNNNEKLINLYNQKQKDFRDQNIDFDEVELEKAKSEYKKALLHAKHTAKYYELKQKIAHQKEKIADLKSDMEQVVDIATNSLNNFINELKNETLMYRNEAFSATMLDLYLHKYKLYITNKKILKELKLQRSSLKYLSFNELKDLSADLNTYLKTFYQKHLNINPLTFEQNTKSSTIEISDVSFEEQFKKIKVAKLSDITNHFKTLVEQNFDFDFERFITISNQRHNKYNQELNEQNEILNALVAEAETEKAISVSDNQDTIAKAKINMDQAQKVFDQELAKYIEQYNVRIEQLRNEIDQQTKKRDELVSLEKEHDKTFFATHKQFVQFYKENMINVAKKKVLDCVKTLSLKDKIQYYINPNKLLNPTFKPIYVNYRQKLIELKVYETNVTQRLNGIDSFGVELKNLNKDLNKIKTLLGINSLNIAGLDKKWSNVLDLVLKPIRLSNLKKLFIKNTIYKALEDVGLLKQFAYRYPHEFSGGQRQRIVIARALITEPKIIVADEPIASLDISIQAQVVNLLKDLCKNKNIGMVFIAHDLSMIEYIADQVQIMHLGKIVEFGDTEAIYANPIHPYTINLFKAIPKISNANEKFQDVKFEISYLQEQQYPNIPSVHCVEKDKHFVFGTKQQFDKWMKLNYHNEK
ncbi:ATP-binding cassette domain-containing protein [Mycoplasma sp. NEAQ87857]|uniref:ATP-binding cassette domain-containing protein n=1 Tax=Mycoplasma sp. NEAQ87857 TaxID=2683967 RepID=UPI001315E3CD|nr:ATP-binding cassette domain-containing protein [Mycoplasma sp. NEAQ87857]QGZ97602.1 ATP-binding cassette domain-containing protein [Mycoplasma sp. NEAQ87857]